MSGKVVMVHPDDMNVADAKAIAAQHDATLVANRYVPRGKVLVGDADALEWRP